MNDPLLNQAADIPPAPPVVRTARTGARKKHPAISARILAAGLSATVAISMVGASIFGIRLVFGKFSPAAARAKAE